MNTKHLSNLQLAIFLLEKWQNNIADSPVKFNGELYYHHSECGTIACGLGYLALQPEMNERGLRLRGTDLAIDDAFCSNTLGCAFFDLTEDQWFSAFYSRDCGGNLRKLTLFHVIQVLQQAEWEKERATRSEPELDQSL